MVNAEKASVLPLTETFMEVKTIPWTDNEELKKAVEEFIIKVLIKDSNNSITTADQQIAIELLKAIVIKG